MLSALCSGRGAHGLQGGVQSLLATHVSALCCPRSNLCGVSWQGVASAEGPRKETQARVLAFERVRQQAPWCGLQLWLREELCKEGGGPLSDVHPMGVPAFPAAPTHLRPAASQAGQAVQGVCECEVVHVGQGVEHLQEWGQAWAEWSSRVH